MLDETFCSLQGVERIDSADFELRVFRHETVSILDLFCNNKTFYLPIKIDKKFPNLEKYFASSCSIKSISRVNFRNLQKLVQLSLSNNKITTIDDDTFDDLAALEELNLGELKYLNS